MTLTKGAQFFHVEGPELHRFPKTYADTLHDEGVSVNTARASVINNRSNNLLACAF